MRLRSLALATFIPARAMRSTSARAPESELRERFAERFVFCDDTCAETFRIERGVPRWGRELTNEIIPVEALTAHAAHDIVYSNLFTGVHGNYLKPSIVAAGMDPDNLPESDASKMSFGTDASGERAKPKAWKEIWGSGQGVGSVGKILPAAELIARFKQEYIEAVDPAL